MFGYEVSEVSEAEVKQELGSLRNRKTGNVTALLLSILLFVSIGLFRNSAMSVAILAFVIFFHEIGHAVGMRMFGYRNVNILFIPMMGAFTSGSPKNPSGAHQAIVTLLGPLPGIILGCLFWILFFGTGIDFYNEMGRALLFINLFNLLPFSPLDGARLFEQLLFSRNAKVELAFKVVTTLLLGLVGFALRSWLLGLLALLGFLALKGQYLNAKLAQNLKRTLPRNEDSAQEEIPPESFASIKYQVEVGLSDRERIPKIIAKNIMDVWQRAHNRAPSLKATLALLFIYFASLFVGTAATILFEALKDFRGPGVTKTAAPSRDERQRQNTYQLPTM